MTSKDTSSGISSQASEAGAEHYDWLDGPMTGQSAQDRRPASHSARQGNNAASTTNDTLPPHGSHWSQPSGLLSSLASRLPEQSKKTTGSMIYSMHWTEKVTPRGRSYYQLVASARRTFDSDCGLWAGWVTASSRDWKDTPGMATETKDGRSRLDQLPRQANLAGWKSPVTQEPGIPLTQRVAQIDMDQPARITADGQVLTGSSAGMESGGQLNPRFGGWLMGYPIQWCEAALQAHRTLSPKRKKRG